MGNSSYSRSEHESYVARVESTPRSMLFSRRTEHDTLKGGQTLSVEKIKYRESRDSQEHPVTMPVITGLDVSGSMGMIAEQLVKGGLGEFMNEVLQRKPCGEAYPHLAFLGIADALEGDRHALQATQFESDTRVCDQITDMILGGGGSNDFEGYDLGWLFAAYRTQTDAWDKRNAKGYYFGIGDEEFPRSSAKDYIHRILGADCPQTLTPESLLSAAQERYYVFHIIAAEGSYARRDPQGLLGRWRQHLQKRALLITDYRKIPALQVSCIAINEGVDIDEALGWWDQDTASVLRKSLTVQ